LPPIQPQSVPQAPVQQATVQQMPVQAPSVQPVATAPPATGGIYLGGQQKYTTTKGLDPQFEKELGDAEVIPRKKK
jgi:hypothetical protein